MIIAFSKIRGGFVCRDFTRNTVINVSKENILNKSIKVDNLKIEGNKVVGNKFDVNRLPEYESSHGRCYIYNVKLTSDGQAVTGYDYITSKGLLQHADRNNLVYFRKYGISNAYVVEDKLDIKNINTLNFEKAFKPISYSSDEYYDIYKAYNNENLLTSTGRVFDTKEQGFIKRNYAQSKFHSFIESHKILNQILLNSKILRVVKIYKNMKITSDNTNCSILHKENDDFFYKVTFIYNGEQSSLIILRKDKKLIKVLNYKEAKVTKTTKDDILDLVIRLNNNDKFTSVTTEVENIDNEESNKELIKLFNNTEGLNDMAVEITKDKIKIAEKEYKIRRSIMIGSADFSLLYNVV